LRHLWHCVVLKNCLFRVTFNCPQHKVHLCNDNAV
jgi:hypothetical protein